MRHRPRAELSDVVVDVQGLVAAGFALCGLPHPGKVRMLVSGPRRDPTARAAARFPFRIPTAAEERGIPPHQAARSVALERIAAATRPPVPVT